jgi:hypothetical protein
MLKYLTGSEVHIGDRVNIRAGSSQPILGDIVFVIDNDEYSDEFTRADWSQYERGFMIRLDDGTLIMYPDANDEHLELASFP